MSRLHRFCGKGIAIYFQGGIELGLSIYFSKNQRIHPTFYIEIGKNKVGYFLHFLSYLYCLNCEDNDWLVTNMKFIF